MTPLLLSGTAIAPILVVLALSALRVPSLRAGAAGLVSASLVAATVFRPSAAEVSDATWQLGPLVIEVAFILLGGVTLSVVLSRTGAQDVIVDWLVRTDAGPDRVVTILLLVFGLTPFMESVTGFGLGVVITAPLLVRIGLTPVRAVVAGLLGLVLVPWGSLGPGTLVAAQLGGEDVTELGYRSAVLSLPVLVVSMVTVLVVLRRRPTPRLVAAAVTVVVIQWASLIAAHLTVGTPPAGVLASGAVLLVLLALLRFRAGGLPPVSAPLLRALVPYLALLAGILGATLLLGLLGDPRGLAWLSNPAVWINVAAVIALVTARRGAPVGPMLRSALTTWGSVAGTAIVFMLIGIVMATAGMAEHLASVAARSGDVFLSLIPAIGALGGYLTGSNTGAAAMFSAATSGAASGLDADTLVALAGQNVAGSYAIILSPPRVALALGVVTMSASRLPRAASRTLFIAVVTVTVLLGGAVFVMA